MVLGLLLLWLSPIWLDLPILSPGVAAASEGAGQAPHGAVLPSGADVRLGPLPEEFSRYEAGWLTIEYHPAMSTRALALAEGARTARDELRVLFGRPVLERVLVRIGRTVGEMEQLGPVGVRLPRYASGVAFSELGLVLLTASPRYPGEELKLPEVLRHELAHVALHDAVGRRSVPRWFNEGFAVYASGEAEMMRARSLWTATLSGNLIPLRDLERTFPADPDEASIAYAQAADVVRFLLARGEEHRFRALFERLLSGQPFDRALSDAYATDLFGLEMDWQKDVAKRYTFWPILFGGSFLWVATIGLLVWGFVRRRSRAAQKMQRWAREEAIEDARRELARALLRQAGPVRVIAAPRVLAGDGSTAHASAGDLARGMPAGRSAAADGVTNGPGAESGAPPGVAPPTRSPLLLVLPPPVPKVEHEGGWHTLH